jgi:hypothetical protein
MKLKTEVQSTPAHNQAAQRNDKADAEQNSAIYCYLQMVNISKQHAKSSHGIKNSGYYCKIMQICGVSMEKKSDNSVQGLCRTQKLE